MEFREVLGIDIGGTFIKAAPVDIQRGNMLTEHTQVETPNPATPDKVGARLMEVLRHFNWNGPVGIGFPGVVRAGVIYTAVNLHEAWIGVNLETVMHEMLDQPVHTINDADAAGLAEMQFGAGTEEGALTGGTVLMVTLGTGIGSALFVRKQLVLNTEFGHIYSEEGIEAEKIAAASVREKNNLSWEAWGARVNWYLNAMQKLVTPDLIIVGGGVAEVHEKFFPYLHVETRVVPARLGNRAGLIGSACAVDYLSPKPGGERKVS